MSKRTPHRRNNTKPKARPKAGGRSPNYSTPSLRKKRIKKEMHKHQTWAKIKPRKKGAK